MTAAVGAGATLAPRLAKRFGARWVLAAGMLSATAGEVLLTSVHPGGSYLANVLPGGVLGALGLGLALVPATIVAVEGVPRAVSGLASGVLNTSRFVGAAFCLIGVRAAVVLLRPQRAAVPEGVPEAERA
jgi:hypothetical protein